MLTKDEALSILRSSLPRKAAMESTLRTTGLPAYTTQIGWLGYSDEQVVSLCKKYLQLGYTAFKAKVGQDLASDMRRCELIRKTIGYDKKFMVDANQVWDVDQAIDWMKSLAKFKVGIVEYLLLLFFP